MPDLPQQSHFDQDELWRRYATAALSGLAVYVGHGAVTAERAVKLAADCADLMMSVEDERTGTATTTDTVSG